MIFLIITVSAIIYFNKEVITKKLLLSVNTYTSGELQIEDIDVNPLVHFPDISLTLNEPRYFEQKGNNTDTINNQIFHFQKLHISFNILELLKSRIEVTAISIEKGSINIVQYSDSTFNIISSLQSIDSTQVDEDTNSSELAMVDESKEISLSIKKINISDVDVLVDLIPGNQKQTFKITKSRASLKYVADSIECIVSTDFFIERIELNENVSIEQEKLSIDLDLYYDRKKEEINIFRSDIAFRSAQFYANGRIHLKESALVDISFEVNDQELQFTKLFLTSEGIDNIKAGELFLNGKIHGSSGDNTPVLECYFGAKNLTIQLPNSSERMNDLTIDGYFTSGTKADLSTAILKIDTITASLSSGYIHGAAKINNLKTPEIYYNMNASLMLQNLNEIFELGPLENLKGRVTFMDKYHGIIQDDSTWMDLSPEPFVLTLDSVSFNLKDIMEVDLLDGSISGNLDSLNLDELYVGIQNSDFLLNGTLNNFSEFFYHKAKPIIADVSIQSYHFDFPGFFSFLPGVARAFPYQIYENSLSVTIETSWPKLSRFDRIPELNFEIHDVSATVESFLPFTQMKGGTFRMHEIDSASIFEFTNFDIEILGSSAIANYKLYDIPDGLDSMEIKLNTNGINPSEIIYASNDTIPNFLDAEIQGNFICDIVLPDDSIKLFHTVRLSGTDVFYYGPDTLSAQSMQLLSSDIALDFSSELNPFVTLSATNTIYFKELVTSVFQSELLDLSINIDNGQYMIIPHDSYQVGKNETGKITLHPFEEPPRYHLEYSIQELLLDEFLESFYSENLFKGKVDLMLNLDSKGNDAEEITSNMSGLITLEGDSLVLTGLNLDDLINNFRRSQSFNLVDLGAVAFAGPAGILYTKGSDYAVLLTAKKGDSTIISKISSNWKLEDGNISIEDVAFATLENRVAAKGWLNMKTDSLDVTIAVVEESGCAIIDQRIYGRSDEPAYSKVKIIKTLLSPVTKVLNNIVAKDCEAFYTGIVLQPVKKSKKKPEK